MSNFSDVGDNPNDKMPPSEPLHPDDAATEDGTESIQDDEEELDGVSDADRENQASTEAMNPDKMQ